MISREAIERACSEVDQYTDEQIVAEFDRFFRAQPALCEFVVEASQESGQKIQELSLFLSYMIYKVVEMSSGSPKTIEQEKMEAAYHDTESWMTQLSEVIDGELPGSVAGSLQRDSEPYLLQYVISELNDTMGEGAELSNEEKGEVFVVLRTVITSLSDNTSQSLS